MFKLVLEKAEEPEIKLPTSAGSLKKQEFQKNIYFCFIDYAKAFDCVDHNKLWKILKDMEIPDHLSCLLRNLYVDQEATIRTKYGKTDWFQTGKGVRQGCILSPCLFNLYTDYIMRNTGLEEAQAGIKIAGRNINNLRYADDTTLMAESEEELRSLSMKVMEPKQKQYPVVDVPGDRHKVRCCKEQYCIGPWNVRSMNQGKLEVVKEEVARVNVDILGISELKWTGMGEYNSDDHYIYYCGQESLRRKGVAITVNKRVQNKSQKRQDDLCSFQRQTIQYHSNSSLCPDQ